MKERNLKTFKLFIYRQTVKALLFAAVIGMLLYIGNIAGNTVFPKKNVPVIMLIEGEIRPGQSLYNVLREDFSSLQAVNLSRALSDVYNPSRVRPGQQYRIYHSTSGEVLKFTLETSPLVKYVVNRTSSGYSSSERVPEYEIKTVAVKGEVTASLWQGMADAGLSPAMIMRFADIFQWQVDFLTEVRSGDRFLMVFDRYYRNGAAVQDGAIHSAWYRGQRGSYTGVRFEDGESVGYYDASGNSLRKQFLRAPLNYTRISSGFSYARRHPITRQVRPHLSIDYAAPTGTPVQSIGSGRVTYVGWRGGWGQTVRVRHNSVYTTQYAHLSRYASGIRVGTNVSQGQVIGYVGMTGTATGPHLCFRIEQNGTPVNFLALEFPPASSVSEENMKSFEEYVSRSREYLLYLESDFFAGQIRTIEEFKNSSEYAYLSE